MRHADTHDQDDQIIRSVPRQDVPRVVALHREALAAEDLIRRILTGLAISDGAVHTVATVDTADRPIVHLTITAAAAHQLAQLLQSGQHHPPHGHDAA